MKALLEAGVHFGHQTKRWNPKMKPYIFTERNGIHIIDLQQTVTGLQAAMSYVSDLTSRRRARYSSSAPRSRLRKRSRKKPSAQGSLSSTSAGWAVC